MSEQSLYELFCESARNDISKYRDELQGNGSFDYSNQVTELMNLQNRLNLSLLVHLFGDKLGTHYAEKYVIDYNRNILNFFNSMDSEARFFLLHQLKEDEHLFAYC